jgi:hypothetical protein
MTAPAIFARRTVFWLLVVGGLSFSCAMVLMAFGEDLLPMSTVEANAYSESAIGHEAFVETLRRLDIPVLVSRGDSALKAGVNDLLIVAEPPPDLGQDQYLNELLEADNVLLVLPKWRAVPHLVNRRWAGEVTRIAPADVNDVLRIVAASAATQRVRGVVQWRSSPIGHKPALIEPQLMTSGWLTPIIDSDQGMLLGEVEQSDGRLWVLSDPDILSNHGLIRGDNALLAVAIIRSRLPDGGTVIVDEVIHGFRRDPSVWRALLEFPIIIITINAVAAMGVLTWAAMGRFGSPAAVEPPLKAGKSTLIGNAAALMQFGGHAGEVLRRYLAVIFADVAHRLHAPIQLTGAALDQWLERIGTARHVRAVPSALRREAERAAGGTDERRMLHTARDLYRWKREMVHGLGDDPLDQRASEAAGAQGHRRPGRGD